MSDEHSRNAISSGTVWFLGWLFTLGFVKLGLVKGLLAIVIWPFYLGAALHH